MLLVIMRGFGVKNRGGIDAYSASINTEEH